MAIAIKRKRESLTEPCPPKKVKFSGFPPAFYDNLSKIWLTRGALQELNRRNPRSRHTDPHPRIEDFEQALQKGGRGLARFARTGGPYLRDLRGYAASMSTPTPQSTHESASASNNKTKRSKRSSAYDNNFEQLLLDNDIAGPFQRRLPKPTNFHTLQQSLKKQIASLSTYSEADFDDFQFAINTGSEETVSRNILPYLTARSAIPNAGNIEFKNMVTLTENQTVLPKPDFFDGVQQRDIPKRIRNDLSQHIVPSLSAQIPALPNFFLELKGPSGKHEVAKRQIVLDGAYGCHAMHSLQNYKMDLPLYDHEARTFSATLCAGLLTLYTHHIAGPTGNEGKPPCVTHQLQAYALTSDRKTWVKGLTAFQNLRDQAKKQRDNLIALAVKASTSSTPMPLGGVDSPRTLDAESSTDDQPAQEGLPVAQSSDLISVAILTDSSNSSSLATVCSHDAVSERLITQPTTKSVTWEDSLQGVDVGLTSQDRSDFVRNSSQHSGLPPTVLLQSSHSPQSDPSMQKSKRKRQ